MIKSPSDKDKGDKTRLQDKAQDAPAGQQEAAPAMNVQPNQEKDKAGHGIGAYGPGSSHANLHHDWEKAKKAAALDETWKGRLAIRLGSRGVLGAAFFAAGGLLTKKWMDGHHGYNPSAGWMEQNNPLKFIAKLIDTTAGKSIKLTVQELAKLKGVEEKLAVQMGENAVRFRPTEFVRPTYTPGVKAWGRSLGDEAVHVTFDFFCASVGDAFGRDLAGWIDPTVRNSPEFRKNWTDENGNFSPTTAVKNALSAVTRYVTYNGGEDWAVAIPYSYYMKGQRALIDKYISNGFKYDFDRGLNGGSLKIDENSKITGSYVWQGALDLQGRFTVYNIGTMMYRELYQFAGNIMKGKPFGLYGDPEKAEHSTFMGKASDIAKWVARSTIKGVICMTPVVPFFWITRATQKKHEGLLINAEKDGIMAYLDRTDGNRYALRANDFYEFTRKSEAGTQVSNASRDRLEAVQDYNLYYARHHPTLEKDIYNQFDRTPVGRLTNPTNFNNAPDYHPYKMSSSLPFSERFFGKIGSWSFQASQLLDKPAQWADQHLIGGGAIKDFLGIKDKEGKRASFTGFTRPFVNASISYTPYMFMKAEAAHTWDDGKMDTSIERMLNGAGKLNWGEFKAGAGEVWRSILHKPLLDPGREAEAQRRIQLDESPPDDFDQRQQENRKRDRLREEKRETFGWRKHLVTGQPEQKVSADSPSKATQPVSARASQYTDEEEMRKVLRDSSPPSSSIH